MISSERTKRNMQFTVILPHSIYLFCTEKLQLQTMAKSHFRENTGATATAFHGSLFL